MPRQLLMALYLAAAWGGSFLFMRATAPVFGAVPLIFIRVALAGLILLPLMWLQGGVRIWRENWLRIAIVGSLITAIPFCMLSWATLSLSAGVTSVLNATTPLMAALWAIPLVGEKMTLRRAAGLILGLVGVLILTIGQGKGFHVQDALLPVAASLLATACYGWSTHMSRIWLAHVPPLVMTCAGLLSGAVLLAPLAWWLWPKHAIASSAWGMALALAVVSTALAYLVFYRLMAQWGATKTTAVVYLVPVFGMLWGRLFLNEPITLTMIAGGLVIITGVMILSVKRTIPAVTTNSIR